MSRFLLVATLLVVLTGLVSGQTGTICERYSGSTTNPTTQSTLIQNIVVRAAVGGNFTAPSGTNYTVNGLFASSGPLYSIFTGATQYRSGAPNYVTDTTSQTALVSKLVAYFGALFGCNAAGYPAINTPNMYAIHSRMGITNAQETYFNTALYTTLQTFGVNATDLNTASTALSWFNRCGAPLGGPFGGTTNGLTQVCATSDCPIAGNSNGTYCGVYAAAGSTGVSGGVVGYISSTGNGASSQYAAGGLFVALAAVAASLFL